MMKLNKTFFRILSSVLIVFLLICVSSCGKEKANVILRVGDNDVSYDMVRYFVMNYKSMYTEDELKDEAILEEIEDATLSSITELYTYKTLADKALLKLTDEEKETIDEQVKSVAELNQFEENYITEETYREILEIEELCSKLYDYLTVNATDDRFKSDNATIDADLETDQWYSAEYIRLVFNSENKDVRKEEMEKIREKIVSGFSMESLKDSCDKEYGDDFSYQSDGCFTTSIYNETYENAVKALETDEVSDVLLYGESWIIVKRLAIEKTYVDENYNSIIAQYLQREFFGYIEETSDSLSVTYLGTFKDKKLTDINE